MRTVAAEGLLEGGVDGVNIGGCVEAERDAALVGDHDDTQSCLIEAGDGLGDAGENVEGGRGRDIVAFGHLLVQDTVAVEEDGGEVARNEAWSHGVMIAMSGRVLPSQTLKSREECPEQVGPDTILGWKFAPFWRESEDIT